jgi:hypothetical protein
LQRFDFLHLELMLFTVSPYFNFVRGNSVRNQRILHKIRSAFAESLIVALGPANIGVRDDQESALLIVGLVVLEMSGYSGKLLSFTGD